MSSEEKEVTDTKENDVVEFALSEKHVKGLKFNTNKETFAEENGKKVRRCYPIIRAAKLSDVLAYKEKSDHVSIVLADGQRHRVKK